MRHRNSTTPRSELGGSGTVAAGSELCLPPLGRRDAGACLEGGRTRLGLLTSAPGVRMLRCVQPTARRVHSTLSAVFLAVRLATAAVFSCLVSSLPVWGLYLHNAPSASERCSRAPSTDATHTQHVTASTQRTRGPLPGLPSGQTSCVAGQLSSAKTTSRRSTQPCRGMRCTPCPLPLPGLPWHGHGVALAGGT